MMRYLMCWTSRSILAFFAVVAVLSRPVSAQEGSYEWRLGRELQAGIRYVRIESAQPRKMVVHGVRVDSQTPGLKFHTTARRREWVEGKAETDRQTTRNFLRQARTKGVAMVAAVNADAFSPWPVPYDQETPTDLRGLAVSAGTLVSRGGGTPSLLVSRDGRLRMATTDAAFELTDVETAVSGFGFCLIEGQAQPGGDDIHPRTGLGLSRDRRVLVIVVIDGRQPLSVGATTRELGLWLKYFGADTGINMDGGGSTTLAWWDPQAAGEDKCRLLNSPVGSGRTHAALPAALFGPSERANGNNLGISLTEPE